MPARNLKHGLRFATGVAVSVLVIILQGTVFADSRLPLYILVPLALIPLVPLMWGMFGWLNALRTLDELQQRIQSEAGLFSLAMTTLSTFGYGFLEVSAGFPKLSMLWILPLVAVTYFIGIARAQWHYR